MGDIALVPWDTNELIDNPTRAWEVWKHSFLAIANLHAPVKKKRETLRPPGSPLKSND